MPVEATPQKSIPLSCVDSFQVDILRPQRAAARFSELRQGPAGETFAKALTSVNILRQESINL